MLPLFVAACAAPGASHTAGTTAPYESPPPPATTSAPGATIATRDSQLGPILVDVRGRTLYLFEADTGTASSCYDACAQYWPPVLTQGSPQAGAGAMEALLGTTQRKDGSAEVTYAGHPLYYFILDNQPSDLKGQGLHNFGGGWYAVTPAGAKIGM